jgi:hypothetical protein
MLDDDGTMDAGADMGVVFAGAMKSPEASRIMRDTRQLHS